MTEPTRWFLAPFPALPGALGAPVGCAAPGGDGVAVGNGRVTLGKGRAGPSSRGMRVLKRSMWLLAAVTCACAKSGNHSEVFIYRFENKQNFIEKVASIASGVHLDNRREVFEALADGLINVEQTKEGSDAERVKGEYYSAKLKHPEASNDDYKHALSFSFSVFNVEQNRIRKRDVLSAFEGRFKPALFPSFKTALSLVPRTRPNVVVNFSNLGNGDDLCAAHVSIIKHPYVPFSGPIRSRRGM